MPLSPCVTLCHSALPCCNPVSLQVPVTGCYCRPAVTLCYPASLYCYFGSPAVTGCWQLSLTNTLVIGVIPLTPCVTPLSPCLMLLSHCYHSVPLCHPAFTMCYPFVTLLCHCCHPAVSLCHPMSPRVKVTRCHCHPTVTLCHPVSPILMPCCVPQ